MTYHYSWTPPPLPETWEDDRKWVENRWKKLVKKGYVIVTLAETFPHLTPELRKAIGAFSCGFRFDLSANNIEVLVGADQVDALVKALNDAGGEIDDR